MRVLHLDGGREMRGGQWQVLRLIEGLMAEGVESTLLARAGAPLFEAARQRGWNVQPLGFARLLLSRGHDVVHAHDARGHTTAALANAQPLIVSRRVAFEIRGSLWGRMASCAPVGNRRNLAGCQPAAGYQPAPPSWKYSRARRYISVSQFVKSVLERGGVQAGKISVVYDGVPVLDPAHGDALMAPASADPLKGSALASEAARLAGVELKQSHSPELDLQDAGIYLYISQSEGLGSAALLAMSAGVPVVASRVGGLPEIVEHGKTGLLVDNDAASIADAIGKLRANPDLAHQLGAEGRRRVQENFTIDHMVRRTMEVYRQVLT
jgi:hypothetical protein